MVATSPFQGRMCTDVRCSLALRTFAAIFAPVMNRIQPRCTVVLLVIWLHFGGLPVAAQKQDGPEKHQGVAAKAYGAAFAPEGALLPQEMLAEIKGRDSLDVKLSCPILTSCAKKGCWMDVDLGNGEQMKVRFKDYGFFVPTEGLAGQTAILHGRVKREIMDVATLRHYAEDAGKSKAEIERIVAPRTEWSFLADGVIIRP
jgi:Domain of unknown function (DUF4920)